VDPCFKGLTISGFGLLFTIAQTLEKGGEGFPKIVKNDELSVPNSSRPGSKNGPAQSQADSRGARNSPRSLFV
jgi:hypothetical protein